MRRCLSLCLIALTLSACGSIFPQPGEPSKKYTLAALPNEGASGASAGVLPPHQLVVEMPTVYPPIDSTRIALKPQAQLIDYYADVEWAERLSALIQESVIYSFQNKGGLRSVSRPTEALHSDYALKIDVRKFYCDQAGEGRAATAQVDYMVHLIKLPERHIVASQHFTHGQIIPENHMDTIINSLNAAHLEVSKALVPWVLGYVS